MRGTQELPDTISWMLGSGLEEVLIAARFSAKKFSKSANYTSPQQVHGHGFINNYVNPVSATPWWKSRNAMCDACDKGTKWSQAMTGILSLEGYTWTPERVKEWRKIHEEHSILHVLGDSDRDSY